jgi:hypothetical protein
MEDVHRKAAKRVPGLCQRLKGLIAFAKETIDNIRYSEQDHLAFMALCFLGKQIDHANSILAIIPGRDAILIARSMIEGLCQLLWAAKDPNVLPLQWRAFAYVHDWRIMQSRVEAGEPVDPETRAGIESALRQFGSQFLKAGAKASPAGQLRTDLYHKDWRAGHQIRQICESVGAEDLHRRLYEPFSDWHHWGAAGLGAAIDRKGERIVYSSLRPADAATALAVGLQCLLQTVQLVDRHLDLGLTARLAELRDEYITWGNNPDFAVVDPE